MLRVEFISSEDDGDLVVSFALAPSAHRSLTLLRSPQYEHLLPISERGITVSSLNPSDVERDLLRLVRWSSKRVAVQTERNAHDLDISEVAEDEIAEAKAVLRKMIKGGVANVEGL